MSSSEDRIIALIDMDCFFCQVESREQPELKNKPMVVCQSNVVLAVSYEARARGVNRFVRAEDAKEVCPELNVVSSPISYGKSDNTKYRSAGQEVIEVLKKHCQTVERASIDEAYLDITSLVEDRLQANSISSMDLKNLLKNTFVVGYCNETNDDEKRAEGLEKWIEEVFDDMTDDEARKLGMAALIVEELRAEILEKCQFTCSAGISYNKVLAKLACGLHKPNKQTILHSSEVMQLFRTVPVNKVRSLGGKVGKVLMESLNCKFMSDLMGISLQEMQKHFDDKTAMRLFNMARGIDNEPVTPRLLCKSIAASKNFFGKAVIINQEGLKEWVGMLAGDLVERLELDLEDNQRRATTLTIGYHYLQDKRNVTQSKTCAMTSYKRDRIAALAFDIIAKGMQTPIVYISIGASKFVKVQKSGNFLSYFKNAGGSQNQKEIGQEINSVGNFDKIDKDNEGHDDDSGIIVGEEAKVDEIPEEETENIGNIELISSRRMNNEKLGDQSNLTKIREIFPDLNNIDVSVLELLPPELQNEAKIYIKSKEQGKCSASNNCSSPSDKLSKKNSTKMPSKIQNFFVKNSPSDLNNCPMIRCTECDQMIEGERYPEHCDFHVAQNLQKDINKTLINRIEGNGKRGREKSASPKVNKKTRGIESYFSRTKN